MLETLRIKNIAIITEAEITFGSGLNIISGETGAGKSVVIQSIAILLGGRAKADLIRKGCNEAVVEGLFSISNIPWMRDWLNQFGFQVEKSELLIKRVVNTNGRHRIYVNGELATLSILKDLCEGLVDLCGQHEHQSLLKPQTQLELIDRFCGITDKVEKFSESFSTFRSLKKEYEAVVTSEDERTRKADFLDFQIKELSDANLVQGEDEDLKEEKKLLQSSEQRSQLAGAAVSEVDAQNLSIQRTIGHLEELYKIDSSVSAPLEALKSAALELEEVSLTLSSYASGLEGGDSGSERLAEVQDRLAEIAALKRKYGESVDKILSTLEKLQEERDGLGAVSKRRVGIKNEIQILEKELAKQAAALTKARKSAVTVFSRTVTEELQDLKMENARFGIAHKTETDSSAWTSTGADVLEYEILTNQGEESRPLPKIASGGELSRIMLAVRRVISDRGGIGVYLFDEIDAGIGGQTAFKVGKKLKSVSMHNQVICITHLPQVASYADNHLIVRKTSKGGRTTTQIDCVNHETRTEEIARMLGGAKTTKASLKNAAELLEMARA